MISERELTGGELEAVWGIDRSESIEAIYSVEDGTLVLRPERHDVRGWPPGEAEKYAPILEDCHRRGGWAYGLFDDQRLIGAAVLESRFIGRHEDRLQLVFLHVSREYRNQSLGRRLFELAKDEAARRGAKSLYISATPSRHTIDFYLRLGCSVSVEPDPELQRLEPEDIHLDCTLG